MDIKYIKYIKNIKKIKNIKSIKNIKNIKNYIEIFCTNFRLHLDNFLDSDSTA